MNSPSYARATAASTKRASLTKTQSKDFKLPQKTETLYHESLVAIKPLDQTKPCPLAALPGELRCQIYDYCLSSSSIHLTPHHGFKTSSLLWPALLRVSRAVRSEAAYVFYARSAFAATIVALDFSSVTGWIQEMPLIHRSYLSRNRSLCLTLDYRTGERVIPSQKTMWSYCHQFGIVFEVLNGDHQDHFLHFCRLAEWCIWCSKPIHKDIEWRYSLSFPSVERPYNGPERLQALLRHGLATVALPCVQKHWRLSREEGKMKREALNLLNGCDEAFSRIRKEPCYRFSRRDGDEWDKIMGTTIRYVENWP